MKGSVGGSGLGLHRVLTDPVSTLSCVWTEKDPVAQHLEIRFYSSGKRFFSAPCVSGARKPSNISRTKIGVILPLFFKTTINFVFGFVAVAKVYSIDPTLSLRIQSSLLR